MIQKIIFALFLLLFASCSNTHTFFKTSDGKEITSASVVTVLRKRTVADLDGSPRTIGYEQNCNAFYVRDYDTRAYLITAAHCVPEPQFGSDIIFITSNNGKREQARIIYIDNVFDIIYATTTAELTPLVVDWDYYPEVGDSTVITSSLYDKTSNGFVAAHLTYGWVQTSNTIKLGWSGSPVMNGYGQVWGITSKCPWDEARTNCQPGSATVTMLYK